MRDVPRVVLADGGEHRLEVLDYRPAGADRPAGIRARIDGRQLLAEARALGEGRWLLSVEGRTVLVRVAACGHDCWVGQGGSAVLIRPQAARPASAPPGEVTPSMPAVVVKVLVGEGQRVQRGQALVVITAMKMETTLVSPRDGVVAAVKVAAGDKVVAGQVLCEVVAEEEADEL
ncbi:MAG: hypothetical protein DRI34_08980 [Deltaproteobacteria bacterium]|nr:MAG: hypothetical protein DRI34_08980 [Deltaproteobacteria bacterium]